MNTAQKVAKILLDTKAVKVRIDPPFDWNTGLKSPMYCDNKWLISFPEERRVIIDGFKKLIKENNLEFDTIAGTAAAGIPWASFLAWELDKPMVFVRAQPKDYGLAKQVEGTMPKGSRVLVVEDLISTGRSSLTSVTACQKEYDAKIVAVLAIVTYEMQIAKESFEDTKVPLFILTNFSTIIQMATEEKYLTQEEKESALAWGADPEAWHKAHGGKEILKISK